MGWWDLVSVWVKCGCGKVEEGEGGVKEEKEEER